MNKVTALSLLSNAVLVWNSVRFVEVEATTGDTVAGADLPRVPPLAHVIPSGTYRFPKAALSLEYISLVGAWDPKPRR